MTNSSKILSHLIFLQYFHQQNRMKSNYNYKASSRELTEVEKYKKTSRIRILAGQKAYERKPQNALSYYFELKDPLFFRDSSYQAANTEVYWQIHSK